MAMIQLNYGIAVPILSLILYISSHILYRYQSVVYAKRKIGWILFDLQHYARSQAIADTPIYKNIEGIITISYASVGKLRLYSLIFWLAKMSFYQNYRNELLGEMQKRKDSYNFNQLSDEQRIIFTQEMEKFSRCILSLLFFRTPVTIALLPIFVLSLVMTFIVMFLALNALKPIKQHVVASRKFFAETIESIASKQFFSLTKSSALLNFAISVFIISVIPSFTHGLKPINHDMLQTEP